MAGKGSAMDGSGNSGMTKLSLKAPEPIGQDAPQTRDIEVRAYHTPEAMAAPHRPMAPVEADAPPRLMHRNPLLLLGIDGVLPAWSVRAGQEVARVYRLITSASAARVTAGYGERLDRGDAGEDLAPSLRSAYADRYAPWRSWAGGVAVTPQRSLADLTLMVCVEELGLWQAAQRVGLHRTTVKRRLQASLHWYAANADWLPEKNR